MENWKRKAHLFPRASPLDPRHLSLSGAFYLEMFRLSFLVGESDELFSVKLSEMSFLVRKASESALSVESSEMRFYVEKLSILVGAGNLSRTRKSRKKQSFPSSSFSTQETFSVTSLDCHKSIPKLNRVYVKYRAIKPNNKDSK